MVQATSMALNSSTCYFNKFQSSHVVWVPCHHGMARPLVADGGDGLQLWRVAANILDKQSPTAENWWSSRLLVGRCSNNSSRKECLLRNITKDSELDLLFGTS
jgi:hypothetical protein